MIDSVIERQAIRAALALAVASAYGHVADAIAEMRDEATYLIGLCFKEGGSPDEIRQWCDGATALVERLSSDGTLPGPSALSAAAAILRLRLAVTRNIVPLAKKKVPKPTAAPVVAVGGNQKVVMDFIVGHPDIRTKNLIDSLKHSLSSRTVKRCLKELCDAGLLHRTRENDGGVLYRVDSEV